jgi:hypothetical protein
LRVRSTNTLAIAALIEQALCLSGKTWRGEGIRREDKQMLAIGKFCKFCRRASSLKKPLALQRETDVQLTCNGLETMFEKARQHHSCAA